MDNELIKEIKDAEIRELKNIHNKGYFNSMSYEELKNYYDNYHKFFPFINRLRKSIIYRLLRKIKRYFTKKNVITPEEEVIVKKEKINRKTPKILLVVDVKDWCFWNIAHEIKKNLKEFAIIIIPLEELDNNLVKLFFYAKDFDLIHFFWRGHLSFFNDNINYMNECGISYEDFMNNYVYNKIITTSVYDHLYLDDADFTNNMFRVVRNYSVSSKKLKKLYDENTKINKKPMMVITDGVDLDLFKLTKKRDFKNKKITIGWVGNSLWQNGQNDIKGFNTILKPVLESLKEEGYPIECYFADKQTNFILHKDMPEYYQKIDICLCASLNEGTPNPVLEAMAMGAAIISTDVGIVKDVLGKKQQEFIVKRTKEDFKEKIIKLINNPELLKELSEENLHQIKKWDWKIITKDFQKFFKENLKED